MNRYRSPLYPALMVRLPGEGRRNIKAAGGVFNVAEEDVEAFEAFVAERPHYKIELVGTQADETPTATLNVSGADTGSVTPPEPASDSEKDPSLVVAPTVEALKVPELRERLEAAGLPSEGRKPELVERLTSAITAGEAAGVETTDESGPDTADATDESVPAGEPADATE